MLKSVIMQSIGARRMLNDAASGSEAVLGKMVGHGPHPVRTGARRPFSASTISKSRTDRRDSQINPANEEVIVRDQNLGEAILAVHAPSSCAVENAILEPMLHGGELLADGLDDRTDFPSIPHQPWTFEAAATRRPGGSLPPNGRRPWPRDWRHEGPSHCAVRTPFRLPPSPSGRLRDRIPTATDRFPFPRSPAISAKRDKSNTTPKAFADTESELPTGPASARSPVLPSRRGIHFFSTCFSLRISTGLAK